jgi:hypothetical protein
MLRQQMDFPTIHSSAGSLRFFCLYLISKRLNIYYQTLTLDINGREAK